MACVQDCDEILSAGEEDRLVGEWTGEFQVLTNTRPADGMSEFARDKTSY